MSSLALGCSGTTDLDRRVALLERVAEQREQRIAALEAERDDLEATNLQQASEIDAAQESLSMASAERRDLEARIGEVDDTYLRRQGSITEGTPLVQWRYTPDGEGRAPFEMKFGGSRFYDTFDNVMAWGYNVSNTEASEPMFVDQLETDYEVTGQPGVHWMERFWEFRNIGRSVNLRPLFVQCDRDTGQASVTVSGNGATGYIAFLPGTEDGNRLTVKLVGDAVQVTGVPVVWVGKGEKTMLLAQNATGTRTLSVLTLDAHDRIKIGGSGVVSIDEAGFKLGFFNQAPVSKPTITGSRSDPAEVLSGLLYQGAQMGLWNDATTP